MTSFVTHITYFVTYFTYIKHLLSLDLASVHLFTEAESKNPLRFISLGGSEDKERLAYNFTYLYH